MFFDQELKAVLGIDVYASEFPKSKGYKIYKEKRSDVLVIRLENLHECAEKAFIEFLNVDRFKMINENVGSEKNYGHIYGMFKDSVVLPDSYIEKMYSSKYMKHFYSEEEIKKFRKKYTKMA